MFSDTPQWPQPAPPEPSPFLTEPATSKRPSLSISRASSSISARFGGLHTSVPSCLCRAASTDWHGPPTSCLHASSACELHHPIWRMNQHIVTELEGVNCQVSTNLPVKLCLHMCNAGGTLGRRRWRSMRACRPRPARRSSGARRPATATLLGWTQAPRAAPTRRRPLLQCQSEAPHDHLPFRQLCPHVVSGAAPASGAAALNAGALQSGGHVLKRWCAATQADQPGVAGGVCAGAGGGGGAGARGPRARPRPAAGAPGAAAGAVVAPPCERHSAVPCMPHAFFIMRSEGWSYSVTSSERRSYSVPRSEGW
jgi:hypothetical protein